MSPEAIVAIIGAVLGPISGMFALYMREASKANARRGNVDAKLAELVAGQRRIDRRLERIEDHLEGCPVPQSVLRKPFRRATSSVPEPSDEPNGGVQ